MDPFSALGLASNVLQSVDYGGNLIYGGLEAYNSVDNSSFVVSDLESIREDLAENFTGLSHNGSFFSPFFTGL
jgi:hypothetical protein